MWVSVGPCPKIEPDPTRYERHELHYIIITIQLFGKLEKEAIPQYIRLSLTTATHKRDGYHGLPFLALSTYFLGASRR